MAETSNVRVARDERGERVRFEDIEIGQDLGTMEWIVTPDMIATQCETDATFHEWYQVGSPFGGCIAPTQMGYLPPRLLLGATYNLRGLFYKWELENINPIRPNKRMIVSARVVDKWVNKNQREFVTYEAVCTDEDGDVIYRTRRSHALDYIPRTAPREGFGLDSGSMKHRVEARKGIKGAADAGSAKGEAR